MFNLVIERKAKDYKGTEPATAGEATKDLPDRLRCSQVERSEVGKEVGRAEHG